MHQSGYTTWPKKMAAATKLDLLPRQEVVIARRHSGGIVELFVVDFLVSSVAGAEKTLLLTVSATSRCPDTAGPNSEQELDAPKVNKELSAFVATELKRTKETGKVVIVSNLHLTIFLHMYQPSCQHLLTQESEESVHNHLSTQKASVHKATLMPNHMP